MRLGDARDAWLLDLQRSVNAGNLSANTIAVYRRDINTFTDHLGADASVRDITAEDINNAFDAFSDTPDARFTRHERRGGKARSTLTRYYSTISVFFSDAQRRGWVAASPVPDTYLARGKTKKATDPRRASVGIPGAAALLTVPDLTARDEFLLRLLLETGARVGEVCAADRADLVQEDAALWWLTLRHTKNGKPRRVPVTPETADLYGRYRDKEMVAAQPRPHQPDSLVDAEMALIRTSRGRRITPRDVQNVLRRVGVKAGVRVTPHGLRHTAATVLLESGADVHHVRDLLGHSSISVTSQYLDTNGADVAAAVVSSPLARLSR